MSVIVYCADDACFNKILCDKADDVMKLAWSKVITNNDAKYECKKHTWETS